MKDFFIETEEQVENGIPGLILTSEADFICYYFFRTSRLFIFDTNFLRRWTSLHKHAYDGKPTRTPTGNSYYTTQGILVPISALAAHSLTISQLCQKILSSIS
jgi:hypothetical protein